MISITSYVFADFYAGELETKPFIKRTPLTAHRAHQAKRRFTIKINLRILNLRIFAGQGNLINITLF